MFDILITKSALRQLNRMPKNIKQTVIKKIARVAANPHAPKNNVKPLRKGDFFRLRIGSWRVIYTVDNESKTMHVIDILPRGNAYQ